MNRTGFRKLKSLLDFFHNPEVVFEATGVYSRRLQRFLIMQRVNYVQLNPLKARIQLNKFRRFKTDQADAKELANTQFIIKRSFSYQMDPVYSQLRDLSRFYQEINKDIVAHKNRLHKYPKVGIVRPLRHPYLCTELSRIRLLCSCRKRGCACGSFVFFGAFSEKREKQSRFCCAKKENSIFAAKTAMYLTCGQFSGQSFWKGRTLVF